LPETFQCLVITATQAGQTLLCGVRRSGTISSETALPARSKKRTGDRPATFLSTDQLI